jgi:hypothetical protein
MLSWSKTEQEAPRLVLRKGHRRILDEPFA